MTMFRCPHCDGPYFGLVERDSYGCCPWCYEPVDALGRKHGRSRPTRRGKHGRAKMPALAERDGWVCHLCGDAINPELRRDPYEPTLDHLVPSSL